MSCKLLPKKAEELKKFGLVDKAHKLTPLMQLEVCRRIAWFWTEKELLKYIQSVIKKSMHPSNLSAMKNSEKWKPVIEQFREEYISKCGEVPLFHKKKRLEELQEQYYHFKEKGNLKEARSILRDIRDEAEGKRGDISFQFTSIVHNEFNQMTDEDLQTEKMKTLEQLEKVRRMKLLTNQGDNNGLGIKDAQEI